MESGRCAITGILLCMGLFSRFYAKEALRRFQGDRLVLRAYGESIQLQPIML